MTKEDKERLESRQLTESILFACLATCESIISKNAYLEKKWKNTPSVPGEDAGGWEYRTKRLEWMSYREKLRSILLKRYQMKQIIQMTKSCTDKATQENVKTVVGLIDTNDYTLV